MEGKGKYESILAEVGRRKEEDRIIEVEEDKTELVIFSLNDSYYAFHGANIREILRVDRITYVPGSPNMILGIISVRGDIHSVFSMHNFFGLTSGKLSAKSRIMIATGSQVCSGVLADSVEDVMEFPANSIHPPISTLDVHMRGCVIGETIYKGKSVTILSADSILGNLSP